jgi:hypothetical protein
MTLRIQRCQRLCSVFPESGTGTSAILVCKQVHRKMKSVKPLSFKSLNSIKTGCLHCFEFTNQLLWLLSFRTNSEFDSYITIEGQSTSLSWNKAPIWGLRPDFYYCQTAAGLLIWGAVFDERTDLPFTISAGLRRRSHFRVPVSRDSRPYFTVSDSRLPFSSPRTTRRVTACILGTVCWTLVYTETCFVPSYFPETAYITQYCHIYVCYYRRGLDWILDLLTTCI